jgi:hypothetical protein
MSEELENWDDFDEEQDPAQSTQPQSTQPQSTQPQSTQPQVQPSALHTLAPSNRIIIPLTQSLIHILLGSSIQNQYRSRALSPEPETEPSPKRARTNPSQEYAFSLQSGEEFYFTEQDGKNVLLNEHIEPNPWVRKIISVMPSGIKDRLRYLAKFRYHEREEEMDHDVDDKSMILYKKPKLFYDVPTQVCSAYIREMKLRTIFRGVLQRWRIYHLNKKKHEEIDPITLSPPIKIVQLYDWKYKKKYIFDANSLATLIESKLLYHEYGFPMPLYPGNPWTNLEFTYYEMISIYYQLQSHGELRWGLITLKQHDFNIKQWQLYHKSALTMKAIRNNINVLDNRDAQDMLQDFIFSKMDEIRMTVTPYIITAYRIAMRQCPYHWYLELWKSLTFQQLEAEHFGQNKYVAIQAACKALLKKHELFLKELIQKGLIQRE